MIRFFVALVFITIPAVAGAEVVITEVMYDLAEGSDSGREWLEIVNAGAMPVTLTEWKVFENGTNHKITAVAGGSVVASGAYAVIADNALKFKADWPNYSGVLFDSAFSLSNDGETVTLRDKILADADSATFAKGEGSGTGDSLQRAGSGVAFGAGVPTPGAPIPVSGLVKSPSKASSKSSAKKQVSVAAAAEIIGEKAVPREEVHVAAAAESAAEPSLYWWLAPLLLASAGSLGIVTSRHFRKDEWDIIEEIEESS